MNRREAIKAVMAMPGLTAIKSADLKPNDAIVLEFPGILSKAAVERIMQNIASIWPDHKCIVLEQGMTMKTVRATT